MNYNDIKIVFKTVAKRLVKYFDKWSGRGISLRPADTDKDKGSGFNIIIFE